MWLYQKQKQNKTKQKTKTKKTNTGPMGLQSLPKDSMAVHTAPCPFQPSWQFLTAVGPISTP